MREREREKDSVCRKGWNVNLSYVSGSRVRYMCTALFTYNMYSKCSDFVHAPRMLTAYFNLCTPHLKERN